MEKQNLDASDGRPGPLAILCLGDLSRAEFGDARCALEAWGTVVAASDVSEGIAILERESLVPDVVVVAQSYPDEFSESKIEPIRSAAPLARMVALLGPWCEGETRTGRPLPGAIRVFWHQWASHCDRELGRLLAGGASIWSLPPTAGEEERCLVLAGGFDASGAGLVDFVTWQHDLYELLADGCRRRGHSTRWLRPHEDLPIDAPGMILFDAPGETDEEIAILRRLRSYCHAPVIVLADFPRCRDRDRFLMAGAQALVARPFLWDDLFWHFERHEAERLALVRKAQ
jgi:CheY-like chemotaxis protein